MGKVLQRVQNEGDNGIVGVTLSGEKIKLASPVPDFLYSCPEQPLPFNAHNEFLEREKLRLAENSPEDHYLEFGIPNYFVRSSEDSKYSFAVLPVMIFERRK